MNSVLIRLSRFTICRQFVHHSPSLFNSKYIFYVLTNFIHLINWYIEVGNVKL